MRKALNAFPKEERKEEDSNESSEKGTVMEKATGTLQTPL